MNNLCKKKRGMKHIYITGAATMGIVSLSMVSIDMYKYSPLREEASVIDGFNQYYAQKLHRKYLDFASGPHYWKGEDIVWLGERNVMSVGVESGDITKQEVLPKDLRKKRVAFSGDIIADDTSVYYRNAGVNYKILSDFLCWHECGSKASDGSIIVGSYGEAVYRYDHREKNLRIIKEKPVNTTHFHFSIVDQKTDRIFSSLGDSHKAWITGILSYNLDGSNEKWVHKTERGDQLEHRQPTAVLFEDSRILFGSDAPPHGIYALDRGSGNIISGHGVSEVSKSWFTGIVKAGGSYWATSRSFSQTPRFGVLWWSKEGRNWYPIQYFEKIPLWLKSNDSGKYLSVGFGLGGKGVYVYKVPKANTFEEAVSDGPEIMREGARAKAIAINRAVIDWGKNLIRLAVRKGI